MSRTAPSPFAVRGVIEGFYGNPWTHEQRLELIRFIAARGMNTFVYAPKDDPLVRRDWRAPYDGRPSSRRLAELVNVSRAAAWTSCTASRPASRSATRTTATSRPLASQAAQSVAALGVSALRPAARRHPDRAPAPRGPGGVRGPRGRPTSRVANRGHANGSGPGPRLIVCPTRLLGQRPRDVPRRRWAPGSTRASTCSGPGARSARRRSTPTTPRRSRARPAGPPTYWDNYPVNDVAMGYELHIGPVPRPRPAPVARTRPASSPTGWSCSRRRRSRSRPSPTTSGDPRRYDPESELAARDPRRRRRGGPRGVRAVRGQRPLLVPRRRGRADRDAGARGVRRSTGSRASGGAGRLGPRRPRGPAARRRGSPAARAGRERGADRRGRPWLEAFETGAQAIRRIADLAAEDRLERDASRPSCGRTSWSCAGARVRVFGDALDMTLADLTGTMSRPGALTLEERRRQHDQPDPGGSPPSPPPRSSRSPAARAAPPRQRPRPARRHGLARRGRRSASGTTSATQFEAAHPGVKVEMNYRTTTCTRRSGSRTC